MTAIAYYEYAEWFVVGIVNGFNDTAAPLIYFESISSLINTTHLHLRIDGSTPSHTFSDYYALIFNQFHSPCRLSAYMAFDVVHSVESTLLCLLDEPNLIWTKRSQFAYSFRRTFRFDRGIGENRWFGRGDECVEISLQRIKCEETNTRKNVKSLNTH